MNTLICKSLVFLRTLFTILIVTLVLFVLINLLSFHVIQTYPELLLTDAQRTNENTRAVREKMLPEHLALKWYEIESIDEVKDIWEEFFSGPQEYEAYTQYRHKPLMGKYYLVTKEGYRLSREPGPWPPDKSNYNIFFFGGSTAFQPGPAWTSVASYLQDILNEKQKLTEKVFVYNFGRSGYFTTQEQILFQELLKSNYIPDAVVFFDGLNDFCYTDGKPGGWTNVAKTYNDKIEAQIKIEREYNATIRWNLIKTFLVELPATKLARSIADYVQYKEIKYTGTTVNDDPKAAPDKVLMTVIQRYIHNLRQIEGISKEYNIQPIFVWQPIPTYKYNAEAHMFYPNIMGCHRNSIVGYPLMANYLKSHPLEENFIWAADMQENINEPLYIDAFHYTAPMSKMIANYITDALISRKLLK